MDTKSKNNENPSQASVTDSDSAAAYTAANAESAAVNSSVITDSSQASQNSAGAQQTQTSFGAQASQNSSKAQQAQAQSGTQQSAQNSFGTQQSTQNSFGTQQYAQPPFDPEPSGPEKMRSFFSRKKNQTANSSTPSSASKPSTWIATLLIICSGITIAFFPGARDSRYWNSAGYVWDSLQDTLGLYYLAVLALLTLLAILLPFFKRLRQNNPLVKRFPAELAVLAIPGGLLAQQGVTRLCYWYALGMTVGTDAIHIALSFCVCIVIYGIWLLTVLSLLQIPDMGAAPYFREKSFLIRNGSRIGSAISRTVRQFVHDLTTINLGEGSDRWLFKIVAVNFLALLGCAILFGAFFLHGVVFYYYSIIWCIFWAAAGLLFYSGFLFFILRRYVIRVKGQYQALLNAAAQLAQGNLQSEMLNSANSAGGPQSKASNTTNGTGGPQSETSNPANNSGNPQSETSNPANGTGDLGIFEPIRQALTTVNAGFRKAVDLEMRSQAMKTELITNVSHDLKTPLTAIITYVNLLKDESITDEERREYVDILDRKSMRLKKLIEDLFEVSKAASGNIEIQKSQVDLAEMVRQAVAEQQDRLQAAGIDCRVNTPYKRVTMAGASATTAHHIVNTPPDSGSLGRNTNTDVDSSFPGTNAARLDDHNSTAEFGASGNGSTFAPGNGSAISYDRVLLMLDSERTYRILENLLVNVSKYALPGTRAWVQLEIIEGEAFITVKNTSAAELDFDISTLTDRFVRGDKSRNTDGSGLGLAIVKNFTELQGGTFEITTDGDLFKAIVRFPCAIPGFQAS